MAPCVFINILFKEHPPCVPYPSGIYDLRKGGE